MVQVLLKVGETAYQDLPLACLKRVVSCIDPSKNWGNTIAADLTTNLGKVAHKLNCKAETRAGIETPFVQRKLLKGCLKVVGWLV